MTNAKPLALDLEQIQYLASIGCSDVEIAYLCHVSERTLQRRCRDTLSIGRARLAESIRRKQFELAMGGNVTMLIWLGKIYCGQREVTEQVVTVPSKIVVDLDDTESRRTVARVAATSVVALATNTVGADDHSDADADADADAVA